MTDYNDKFDEIIQHLHNDINKESHNWGAGDILKQKLMKDLQKCLTLKVQDGGGNKIVINNIIVTIEGKASNTPGIGGNIGIKN